MRPGEEAADLRQELGVGAERIEIGERKRRQCSEPRCRGDAKRVGPAAESVICRGPRHEARAQHHARPRLDRHQQQRLAFTEIARDDDPASATVGAAATGDRPGMRRVASPAWACDIETPLGRLAPARTMLSSVIVGKRRDPAARERKATDRMAARVTQNPACNLEVADVRQAGRSSRSPGEGGR